MFQFSVRFPPTGTATPCPILKRQNDIAVSFFNWKLNCIQNQLTLVIVYPNFFVRESKRTFKKRPVIACVEELIFLVPTFRAADRCDLPLKVLYLILTFEGTAFFVPFTYECLAQRIEEGAHINKQALNLYRVGAEIGFVTGYDSENIDHSILQVQEVRQSLVMYRHKLILPSHSLLGFYPE